MLFPIIDPSDNEYDLVICGGGLAGQTLARQLKNKFPSIKVLLIDKSIFPLPAAACKVGESTVEIGAFYFAESLDLKNYFKNYHLVKMGLRFFFGDSQTCLSNRPEIGLSKFTPYDSFQIDRGVFESDLCRMNKRAGVIVIEGATVQEINIHKNNGLHKVVFKLKDSGFTFEIKGKWVVDAMGRRSFLQRKLGLKVALNENCSAAWFRVRGRFDCGDTVPESNASWHQRAPNRIRYYSTNHMMGKGYWVWIIPLSSGNTSIGIVTLEKLHPCTTYNSQEKAMKWLEENEPRIYRHLQNFEFIDFLSMKNYSYSSKQIFSKERWACIGEAGVFSDPFYAPGSNVIGFGNSCVTKMIEMDLNGSLTDKEVNHFNNFIISYNDSLTWAIQQAYPYFGNCQVMSLNYLWDSVIGWALVAPQMFNSIYLDIKKSGEISKITSEFYLTTLRVKQLFKEWDEKALGSFTFEFIDYLNVPFIREIYNRNLKTDKSFFELQQDYLANVEILDQFALVIFFMAIEDTMPDKLELIKDRPLNTKGLSLNPGEWENDGLFNSTSAKNIQPLLRQVKDLYTYQSVENIKCV